jgi:hypothetical protein
MPHPRDCFGLGVCGDRNRLLARAGGLAAGRVSGVRGRLAARASQAWHRRGGRRRRAFRHRMVRRAIPRVRRAARERHSAFHGMMTRSSSLRTSVIRKPMIAITNRPTYICSTANVLHALQIK